jgi:hypothetical protein
MLALGFSAELSLYRSNAHYRANAGTQAGGQAAIVLADATLTSTQKLSDSGRADQGAVYQPGVLTANLPDGVLPMSVPGHRSDPGDSSGCNSCVNGCEATEAGCIAGAALACAALLAVPIAGPALFEVCVGSFSAACVEVGNGCITNCSNIGSPCCPVACGSGCCDSDETCGDSGQSLCCSPGTAPCGPNCCTGNEVCMEGVCCPPGTTVCPDGSCCDNVCAQCQGGTCVPFADATPCEEGVCCGGVCQQCCHFGQGCNRAGDCCSNFCCREGGRTFCCGHPA